MRAKPPMLVSKQVMIMPLRKVDALLEYMQCGVHRKLTLKCLDEDQVERLFSKEHASQLEFNQALAEELRLKEASLRSTVSALKADCEAVKNKISEIRDETRQLREERKLMELEIEARKRQIACLRSKRKTTT